MVSIMETWPESVVRTHHALCPSFSKTTKGMRDREGARNWYRLKDTEKTGQMRMACKPGLNYGPERK